MVQDKSLIILNLNVCVSVLLNTFYNVSAHTLTHTYIIYIIYNSIS